MTTDHWPEYVAEAAALGLFMVSAMVCTVLLEHADSPVRQALHDAFVRRLLMGAAMGTTAAAIIYSPLGARSGAHMNPAVTLAFLFLGRITTRDAVAYILAQGVGAFAGVAVATAMLGDLAAAPSVDYVRTAPGPDGIAAAVAGEALISFLTLSILLVVAARPTTMRATGLVAGVVVMLNITFEAPLSGMSMNPARSLAPAVIAGNFSDLWIYLTVPPLAMAAAAAVHRRRTRTGCAKFNHASHVRCIFCEA